MWCRSRRIESRTTEVSKINAESHMEARDQVRIIYLCIYQVILSNVMSGSYVIIMLENLEISVYLTSLSIDFYPFLLQPGLNFRYVEK